LANPYGKLKQRDLDLIGPGIAEQSSKSFLGGSRQAADQHEMTLYISASGVYLPGIRLDQKPQPNHAETVC
jgi:hypothetical protein